MQERPVTEVIELVNSTHAVTDTVLTHILFLPFSFS